MNIRSIDLQVLIPRATEVSKSQQIVFNQNTMQHQQFAEEWRQLSSQRQHQVQHTAQTEEGVITERDSREGNKRNPHKKHKPRKSQTSNKHEGMSSCDPDRGSIIDIKT